jgi:hypothetical protein
MSSDLVRDRGFSAGTPSGVQLDIDLALRNSG